jgi:putative endonuclease
MFSGRLMQATIRGLDWIAARTLPAPDGPAHQKTGRRGEEDTYFYLRRRGYVVVARNYRSSRHRGEIDLIAWDGEVLCFIEVKTRTTRDVKPAEAAVGREKERSLIAVAREYLGHCSSPSCQWRFDVVAVYYLQGARPEFQLFQNAFSVS